MTRTVQLSVITFVVSSIAIYAVAIASLLIPPAVGAYIRPYECNDPSISNPLKHERISTTLVSIIMPVVFVITIIITEVVVNLFNRYDVIFKYGRFKLPALLVHIFAFLGYVQLGFASQMVLNQVTKFAIGRLRPHFLTVCKPEVACTVPGQLIYNYTCTGEKKEVDEARLSFFSGHSSLTIYTATFLSIYLYKRLGSFVPRALLVALQTFLFTGAAFIAFTRIQDYFHHPTDVASGVVIGFLGAIYTYYAWTDHRDVPLHGQLEKEETVATTQDSRTTQLTSVEVEQLPSTSKRRNNNNNNDLLPPGGYPPTVIALGQMGENVHL